MRRRSRSDEQITAAVADLAVDAIVVNALRAHGRSARRTMGEILAYHDNIGIDLLEMTVDVDLGHAGADGTVHSQRWEPAGRYSLTAHGLRSVSMPVTASCRWVGPGRFPTASRRGMKPTLKGAHLVVDRAWWPESVQTACVGRHMADVVGHPWLEVEGLIIRACDIDPAAGFAILWTDEVMIHPSE